MSTSGLQALSDADLDALAEFLGNNTHPDAMTLEGLDGLFCALIASPECVPPHRYLPVIWGGDLPDESAFTSIEEANTRMSLIMRYWNSIIGDFEQESIHMPYMVEPGIDGIPGRAWARGFMRGTRLASSGWDDLWASETEGQVISIPLVAGEVDPDWPKEPLTPEKSDELLKWMIAGAARAYRYFADARRESAEDMFEEPLDDEDDYYPEAIVRSEPKVGAMSHARAGVGRSIKNVAGRWISPAL
jgi:yecA family protein